MKNRFHIQPLPLTPTFALFATSTFPIMHLIPPSPPPPKKKKLALPLFFISLRYYSCPKRHWKQCLWNFGVQIIFVMGNVEEVFPWKKKKKNAWSQVTFTLVLKQRLGVTLPFGFNLDWPHYHFRLWPLVKTERMKSCENLTWIMCWLFLAGWLDTPQMVSTFYGAPSSW